MKKARVAGWAVFLALFWANVSFAAENHPWKGFKVGSWVEHKIVSQGAESKIKYTVKDATAEGVTLGVTYVINGNEGEDSDEEQAFNEFNPDPAPANVEPKNLGEESITVDGKAYKCSVKEYTTQMFTMKVWLCAELGCALKVESVPAPNSGGMEAVTVVLTMQEKVKIGDKTVTCKVTETKRGHAGMSSYEKDATSAEVPGGLVRKETRTEAGDNKTESTTEVSGFEVKK